MPAGVVVGGGGCVGAVCVVVCTSVCVVVCTSDCIDRGQGSEGARHPTPTKRSSRYEVERNLELAFRQRDNGTLCPIVEAQLWCRLGLQTPAQAAYRRRVLMYPVLAEAQELRSRVLLTPGCFCILSVSNEDLPCIGPLTINSPLTADSRCVHRPQVTHGPGIVWECGSFGARECGSVGVWECGSYLLSAVADQK